VNFDTIPLGFIGLVKLKYGYTKLIVLKFRKGN
jgi:hypothetical protein